MQNVSWKPDNPMLRLTAYMGLLRLHLFEVQKVLLKAAGCGLVWAALPASKVVKVFKVLNDFKDFKVICGQSHIQ